MTVRQDQLLTISIILYYKLWTSIIAWWLVLSSVEDSDGSRFWGKQLNKCAWHSSHVETSLNTSDTLILFGQAHACQQTETTHRLNKNMIINKFIYLFYFKQISSNKFKKKNRPLLNLRARKNGTFPKNSYLLTGHFGIFYTHVAKRGTSHSAVPWLSDWRWYRIHMGPPVDNNQISPLLANRVCYVRVPQTSGL